MSCHHPRTRRSAHFKNMKRCRSCGALLDRNGREIMDDYDFFRKGEDHLNIDII